MTEFLTQKCNTNHEVENMAQQEGEKGIFENIIENNNEDNNFNSNKSLVIKYNLKEFLDDLILLNTNEDLIDNINNSSGNQKIKQDAVKLMTIHSSKGLEFNTVFIVGVEQGIYPVFHPNIKDKQKHEEEERRMFYVAITRAKQNCFISYAQNKLLANGKIQKRNKSQFIDELENTCLDFSGDYDKNNDINMDSFKSSSFYKNFNQNFNSVYNNKSKSKSNSINFKGKKGNNNNCFKKSHSKSYLNKKRYYDYGKDEKNE